MKNLLDKISKGAGKVLKNTKDFAKRNYNTLALVGTMALAGTTLFSPAKAYSQTPSTNYNNNTKTEQVDTAQNNQPTPDSIIYRALFGPPNTIQNNLKYNSVISSNWVNADSAQRAKYLQESINAIRRLYPEYNVVNNKGDTILLVNGKLCDWYTDLINLGTRGVRNVKQDTTNPDLTGYPTIKQTSEKYNGYTELSHLYVGTTKKVTSGNPHHSVSGDFLFNNFLLHNSLGSFSFRDSQTNYDGGPGTDFMTTSGDVYMDWVGYFVNSSGEKVFGHIPLLVYSPVKTKSSKKSTKANASDWYLSWINPQLQIIDSEEVQLQNKAPADTTINYDVAWANYLSKFQTSVNQDTTQKIQTNDGLNAVKIITGVKDSIYFVPDTTGLANAPDGTYIYNRMNKAKFFQKGVLKNSRYPSGLEYLTTLKENTSSQKITIVKNTTGIFNHKENKSPYLLYPNPMRKGEPLHLRLPQSSVGSELLIQFYDIAGRLLGQEEINSYSQDATINTFKYNLPRGIDLVKITNEETGNSSTLTGIVE